MEITVNGKKQQVEAGTTLDKLLESLKLDPARVAVERNLDVVPQGDFEKTALDDGDVLEIVQFVGGG